MSDSLPIKYVDGAAIEILNLISRRYWQYIINPSLVPASTSQISSATTHKASFHSLDIALLAVVGTVRVSVYMSSNIVDALSDALIPAWREQSVASLPKQWRIVLTISRLSAMLFPDVAIDELQIIRNPPAQSFRTSAGCLCAEVSVCQNKGHIAIICDFSALARLELDFSKLKRSRRSAALPPCQMNVGFLPTRFTVAEFSALGVGDAIVIGKVHGDDVGLKGQIPGFVEFDLMISASGRATIKELRMCEEHEEKITLSEVIEDEVAIPEKAVTEGEQNFLADTFASLPVTLEVRLATLTVPLEYIRDVGPGATLEHPFDLAAPVVIFANGVRFGTGTLIRMGEMVGVQISQWPTAAIRPEYA